MSLTISRLRLRLPAGYEARAGSIARAIADAARDIPIAAARRIDTLTLDPVSVGDGASDRDIAGAAARRLAERLKAGP